MTQPITLSGKCICKNVSINAQQVTPHVEACHCKICQKWSGSSLLALDCGTQVQIEGISSVTVFDSSEWAERGFCRHCGTHLFYRLKHNQQYIVPVGLFDTNTALKFTTQIFIEQKPDFYQFANQTKTMTGAEVFEAFSSRD